MSQKPFVDIDHDALNALIQRVTEAREFGLALSGDDTQLLLDALQTLTQVQEKLGNTDITLHKLRKLLGIERSSEKLSDLLGEQETDDKRKRRKETTLKKRGSSRTPKVKPQVQHHKLVDMSKGDPCPACPKGTLYKYEPARLLRITGQTPFVPVEHLSERLRCNACGAFFTAELPETVQADGDAQQKYGYSARSLIGIYKYFGGSPFYRQGSLQDLVGVPISASTAYDQCELLANALHPVAKALRRYAADAAHFHIDDTTHRIIEQQPIVKKKRNSQKTQVRTGVYSSGIIATLDTGQEVVLFQTDIGHAGEFIDELLGQRADDQPPPQIMSDALSSNRPSVPMSVIPCLCNAHVRRQFVDIISHFPDEVAYVLDRYALIWANDTVAHDAHMTAAQRLAHHRQHSLPIMEEIRAWGQGHLDHETVEQNSALGKAICYFLKHYESLTAFCHHEGARLDNNHVEQTLKLVVRGRKNAMFYKTATGAAVADVIMSMIATGAKAGVNLFEYFNAIQTNQAQVKANPEAWLPWHYQG